MRRTTLHYDGLWRCLCPAFDGRALSRSVHSSAHLRLSSTPSSRNPSSLRTASLPRRRYTTSESPLAISSDKIHTTYTSTTRVGTSSAARTPDTPTTSIEISTSTQGTHAAHDRRLLEPKRPLYHLFSAEQLVAALNKIRNPSDQGIINLDETEQFDVPQRVLDLCKHLVLAHGYPVDVFMYECIMAAMAAPQGSAAVMRSLLKEMDLNGVAPTAYLCQAALAALTVHPNYLLRDLIIRTMQSYWFEIDVTAQQNIAIAMLREGQHEKAFAHLEKLLLHNVRLDLWVYDIFIVEFGQQGFLDEVLHLLGHRKYAKGTDDAFRSVVFNALDVFSRAFHHQGTLYVWNTFVKSGMLNPPGAFLENVLATAAKYNDTTLASEALDMLSSRGRVSRFHYEALIDTFAGAEDVAGALRVMSIMERTVGGVERGSTRLLFEVMTRKPSLVDDAMSTLREVHKGAAVALEAVAVVIEALTAGQNFEKARSLYRDLFVLTGKRPSYGILSSMVMASPTARDTVALAKDFMVMVAKNLPGQDPNVYGTMINACASQKELNVAFEFARRCIALDGERHPGNRRWRRRSWTLRLVEAALEEGDSRIWPMVDVLRDGNDKIAIETEQVVNRHQLKQTRSKGRITKEAIVEARR
ncbi:hypothetical protein G7046_g6636 [Stylonectria norvegica]|nr:hypothetical protein G7046_g6636 [Stylonectria norvegica]